MNIVSRIANWFGLGRRSAEVKFQIYAGSDGQYRWRLVATNGQTVATSGESFASKANATRAAENVKENAGKATIEDA
jgi:uncharacterized protein YegP (UPF0339 family)